MSRNSHCIAVNVSSFGCERDFLLSMFELNRSNFSFLCHSFSSYTFCRTGFYHDPDAGWYYSSKDGLYYKFEDGNYVPLKHEAVDVIFLTWFSRGLRLFLSFVGSLAFHPTRCNIDKFCYPVHPG